MIDNKKILAVIPARLGSKGLKKKNGSCALIYSRLSIGENGVVNACACRDANFSLQIGNASNENLSNIINQASKIQK